MEVAWSAAGLAFILGRMNEHIAADSISRPELLAPAGDWDAARAAVENGADAIYFGLDCGFNARYRAKNFTLDELPELTSMLRVRGVRGYATMNTLAFPAELPRLAKIVAAIAEAGVDAILVQDFGVARLARAICPELELHASTQMSLTSGETIEVARELGIARGVVARELSVAEIEKVANVTPLPLEVFIHGALCVAYSGQCLTSESLGGRSANRGQCAQACRLPYELVCDGEDRDLGDVRYLLSPQDLAGYGVIPELMRIGVSSLKIEGRLKTAEYVANITAHYRRAIDRVAAGDSPGIGDDAVREMELSFSRGFSPGWLAGNDHKRLVPGISSAKRGIRLGDVVSIGRAEIEIELAAPLALGDGVAIVAGEGEPDQGGRVYSIRVPGGGAVKRAEAGERCRFGFGRGEIDWERVPETATLYKNDDPALNRRLRQTFAGQRPRRPRPLDLQVIARAGETLVLRGRDRSGTTDEVRGEVPLAVARQHPAREPMLREKLARLGGSPFTLGEFEAVIEGEPMVPVGMLNQLRRDLVAKIEARLHAPPRRSVDLVAGSEMLTPAASGSPVPPAGGEEVLAGECAANGKGREADRPRLVVLCRTAEQLHEALRGGVDEVVADFHDIREHRQAVTAARDAGVPIALASIRIHKPGENGLLRAVLKHEPDRVLARNLATIRAAVSAGIPAVADFSLNVANHLSAEWLTSLGVRYVTPSYDLNRDQLLAVVDSVTADRLEVVVHQRMPMFHMEHCVFCAVLSPGTDKTNCGRPCDRHRVQLRDRVGAEHVLEADIACRNTLFNATPQSGAEIVAPLIAKGVARFRVELLDEDASQSRRTIDLYRDLLAGTRSGTEVWQTLRADNRVGVTRGTLEPQRNPLAIL